MITPFAERIRPLRNRYLNYLHQVAPLIKMEHECIIEKGNLDILNGKRAKAGK